MNIIYFPEPIAAIGFHEIRVDALVGQLLPWSGLGHRVALGWIPLFYTNSFLYKN
jgi:hypothetical protein